MIDGSLGRGRMFSCDGTVLQEKVVAVEKGRRIGDEEVALSVFDFVNVSWNY